MTRLLLALLLIAPLGLAQDDCDSCGSGCSDCDSKSEKTTACSKTACADLATARKELSTWRTELKGLSRVERNALKGASKTLMEKDVASQALAPTFGATADMLDILAALDSAIAKKETDSIKLTREMATSYRAMAKAIAGKKSYPAPALGTTEELKAALVKCQDDAKKVKALWVKAGEAKADEEVTAALKLIRQADPRMRALAVNAKATGGAIKAMKCEKASAEGDMRPALMKTAKEFHAAAAPYFKAVKLEKPEPMAPAPST
ncbi:MAG: hypothetical protein ACYTEG_17655 [Planctomycetota bacterium]|jgi:hypothetical protein